ncbi:hypothetical protein O6P43_032470 [Quillaja saponaria]|uniref:Uncharacterized protein n=1 Tax=Quillaja saponaria TaxID=32244 RepID=A0AAD7P5C2_QUISA|nr:hypothetical protein O6P43_032470 [Quillaja saponaria]
MLEITRRFLSIVGTTKSFSVVLGPLIGTATWFLRMSGRCGRRIGISTGLDIYWTYGLIEAKSSHSTD